MGFLRNLFERRTTQQPRGPKRSLRRLGEAQGISMSQERCDACGASFVMPAGIVSVTIAGDYNMDLVTGGKKIEQELKGWELDVGGYCPGCKQKLCPKHATFVEGGFVPGMVPGCKKCGQKLMPQH